MRCVNHFSGIFVFSAIFYCQAQVGRDMAAVRMFVGEYPQGARADDLIPPRPGRSRVFDARKRPNAWWRSGGAGWEGWAGW
jgi:hypothetical protein